jgi:hypothetical protein
METENVGENFFKTLAHQWNTKSHELKVRGAPQKQKVRKYIPDHGFHK